MDHYRVREHCEPEGVYISVERFTVIKETTCGYWIAGSHCWTKDFDRLKQLKALRWVSKTSRKRYAYPTQTDAMESFRARKARQVTRLRLTLEAAELALAKFDTYKDYPIPPGGRCIGRTDAFNAFSWE